MPESATLDAPATSTAAPAPPAPSKVEAPADIVSQDISDELYRLDGKEPEPREKKEEPAAKVEEPPKKDAPVIKPKQDAQPKPADKPAEPAKPVKAADLRTAYDGVKKRIAEELEPKIKTLEAKVAEYEKANGSETVKTLTERLTAAERRRDELEQRMQFVDYTKSAEFQDKYQKPYNEAWFKAVNDFNQLTVRIPDGTDETTGEPKFATRKATEQDLLALATMPLSEMDEKAEQMFGRSAPRVIQRVEKIRELAEAQEQATQEAQKKSGEWAKNQTLEQQQAAAKRAETWQAINKVLQTRLPKAFTADEGDADDKAALDKGTAFADLLFLGDSNLSPEQVEMLPEPYKTALKSKRPLTQPEVIQHHAMIRLKAINHDRLARKLTVLRKELDEAKTALAEYEGSAPPAGKGKAADKGGEKGFMESVEAEIDALERS